MMKAPAGRKLWADLHAFAELPESVEMQEIFMDDWLVKVQTAMGCLSCFRKVLRYFEKYPPDYGPGLALWAFCLHDFINKQLGKSLFKPELTLDLLKQKGILH